MADTVRFILDVETPGQEKLGRFRSSLAELDTLAGKAGKSLQSLATNVGTGLQSMATRAAGALTGLRDRLAAVSQRLGGLSAFAEVARGALDGVALRFGALGRAAVSVGASLLRLGPIGVGVAAGLVTIGTAVVGLIKLFNELREAIPRVVAETSELEKMGRRLQIPAEALSGLSFAAKQAGVSLEEIGHGMRGLAKAFDDAQRAGTDANKVLVRDLKFTADELRALEGDPQRALLEIGKRFNEMANGLGKARAAQALFGRGYQAILQLFAEGTPTLEKNIALAERINVAFSRDAIRAGERLGDAWNLFGAALDGVFNRIAASPRLLNGLATLIERLSLAVADFGAALTPERVDSFVAAIGRLVDKVERLVGLAPSFFKFVQLVTQPGAFLKGVIDQFGEGPPAPDFQPLGRSRESSGSALASLRADAERFKREFGDLGGGKGKDNRAAELAAALGELRRKLAEAKGELDPTQAKIEDIVSAFAKFGAEGQAAARAVATELVATQEAEAAFLADFKTRLEDLREPTAQNLAALQTLRGELEARPQGTGTVEALKELNDQARKSRVELDKFGETLTTDLQQRLERAQDPAAALRQEFDGLRKEANKLEAADRDLALSLIDATEAAERTEGAFFDLFGAIEQGGKDVFEALVLGTRSVADAFEGLKISIVGSLSEAFIEGLKKKVGFEGAFKVNLVQFGQNLFSTISNIFGGTGSAAGGGVIDRLFSGVFASEGTGASGAAAAPGGGAAGLAGLLNNLGGQNGLLTGITNAASVIQAFSVFTRKGQIQNFGLNDALQNLGTNIAKIISIAVLPRLAGALSVGLPGLTSLTTSAAAGAGAGLASAGGGGVTSVGASAAGSAIGAIAPLLSIVGSLASIALAFKGNLDSAKALKDVTLGDAAADRFKSTSLATTGIATGIGFVSGGLIGAAIAAAVSQAVNATVAAAIGNATAGARKQGLTQEQFEKNIKDDTGIQILSALGIVGIPGKSGEGLDVFGLIPDIEKIFDKTFTKAFQKLTVDSSGQGFLANRQLTGGPETLTRGDRLRREAFEAGGLDTDAETFSRLLSGVIGAGTDNAARTERFANILINTAAQQKKTFEEFRDLIFKATRELGRDRIGETLSLVSRTFRDNARDQTAREERLANKSFDLVARAFERIAPQLNFDKLIEVLRQSGSLRPRSLRRSRRAVRAAVPALFQQGTTLERLRGFFDAVGDRLREVVEKRLSKLTTNVLDAFLAPLFEGLDKAIKRIKKDGLTPENIARATGELQQAAQDFGALVASGGLAAFVGEIVKFQQAFEDAIFAATIQAQVAVGDISGATDAIKARLEPFVQTLRGFQQLGRDIGARIEQALAGGGFAGERARIAGISDARREAQGRLTGIGITSQGTDLSFDPGKFLGDTKEALALLQEFADLRLQELESELSLARAMRDFWRGIKETFTGFREQISTIRGGNRANLDIFRTRRTELETLLPIARGPEGEERDAALGRISQLIPELLSLGQELFAPGSAQLSGLLDFLDQISREFVDLATAEESKAVEKMEEVRKQLEDFRTDITPIIEWFTARAQLDLTNEFKSIVDALGADGPIGTILRGIADGLGIKLPGFNVPNIPLGDRRPPTKGGPGLEQPLIFPTPGGPGIPLGPPSNPDALNPPAPSPGITVGELHNARLEQTGPTSVSFVSDEVTRLLQNDAWRHLKGPHWAELQGLQSAVTWLGPNPPGRAGGEGRQGTFGPTLEIEARQYGGPVNAMTPYLVGERGPELFTPRTAGTVTANGEFGLGDVNVTVPVTIPQIVLNGVNNPREVADALGEALASRAVPHVVAEIRRAVGAAR